MSRIKYLRSPILSLISHLEDQPRRIRLIFKQCSILKRNLLSRKHFRIFISENLFIWNKIGHLKNSTHINPNR
jgi:hypothetical protein